MKATRYNRGTRKFNVELSGKEFIKMADLYQENGADEVYELRGLFINTKSKFGDKPYVATPDFLMDLPNHMLYIIQNMIEDEEVVQEINEGKVGFRIQSYHSKTYNKECYNIEFVELGKF